MNELTKYFDLPYTVTLRRDNEGDFVGRIVELPGCSAHGKTPQETLKNLDEAKTLWIQDCVENGDPVPLPEEEAALPSGKWLQRVPRKLHRKLQTLSRSEGVSFNQYVTALLAEAVGERRAFKSEQISLHTDEATVAMGHYYMPENFEPLPSTWRVQNLTPCVQKITGIEYIGTLRRLASQLPNRFELPPVKKLKEKKNAKEDHSTLEAC